MLCRQLGVIFAVAALRASAVRVVSRRSLPSFAAGAAAAVAAPRPATALSNAEVAAIVTADVTDRQFLATADLTRSLYADSATFTDEIDTYTIDKFIAGTKKLFVAEKSRVELTSPVVVTDESASFRFQESLAFNLPFVKPIVRLSGKVVLTRDPKTGLFTAYREYWDQSPTEVVKNARLE